ncbi:MAG TPA: type II/IV secretion system protein, partial [Epulopiscium sp.]|nr:type II/IV secretion system protein [Candidatus Epulonipiscium sp.]
RLRIDGQMIELLRTDIEAINAITARFKILSKLDIAERRLPQDGRIQMSKGDQEMDLRVSILPTIYGEKTVIRILYRTGMRLSIEQLGLYPDDEKKFRSMLKAPNGIILVTGPTGSGKSTTLATALREINSPNVNIITVEDPVENIIEGINQVAVNARAGLTFASALRSILRQDPDIIMVGEMRDVETSEIAIRSAITGHFVLSTLHTNDSTSSVARLIDMGCQSYMIGSSVRGIIAQRLVRKICSNCKIAYKITDKEHKLTRIPLGTVVYKGKGCQRCNGKGYTGRMGVYEVFVIDQQLQEMISKNQFTSEQLRDEAIEKGMRTLQDNARWNVVRGYTTVDEMLRITYEL